MGYYRANDEREIKLKTTYCNFHNFRKLIPSLFTSFIADRNQTFGIYTYRESPRGRTSVARPEDQ